ncbi:hypothetical protein [Evansella clarkii]|uniref:hypothetical protein n=1 Tax=Evansella clarkii TaxID=79879 RepID=UPI000998AC0C|nr:hypothetical protein [Evansella clarkii]
MSLNQAVILNSGGLTLQKVTKAQVRKVIREKGSFRGFICGNRVNPAHINDGWHLGMQFEAKNVRDFQERVDNFEVGLRVHTQGLGSYAHFYQIVE